MNTATQHNDVSEVLAFAKLMHAYRECSDELQKHAMEMIEILRDPEIDDMVRRSTAMTLADILYPQVCQDDKKLGMDLEQSEVMGAKHSAETREALNEMDREEAVFADRLREIMQDQGVTQVQLAESLGVGQSAVAMMLQRKCRPQRRTVIKIAEALSVTPQELWEGIEI